MKSLISWIFLLTLISSGFAKWEQIPVPASVQPQSGHTMFFDKRGAIITCGSKGIISQLWMYDLDSDMWTRLAYMPTNFTQSSVCAYNPEQDQIWFYGWSKDESDFDIFEKYLLTFSLETRTFSRQYSNNENLIAVTDSMYLKYHPQRGSLVLFGAGKNVNGDIWEYLSANNSWVQLKAKKAFSRDCFGCMFDVDSSGNIVLLGLLDFIYSVTSALSLAKFNFQTLTWTVETLISPSYVQKLLYFGSSIRPATGDFFLIGGQQQSVYNIPTHSRFYSPKYKSWIVLDNPPCPTDLTKSAIAFHPVTGDLYVQGGAKLGVTAVREFWKFKFPNISTDSAAESATLSVSRIIADTVSSSLSAESRENDNNTLADSQTVPVTAYISMSFMACIVVVSAVLCFRRKDDPKKTLLQGSTRAGTVESEIEMSPTMMAEKMQQTLMNTNQGLFIPGYINYDWNADLTPLNEIARGGFGTVLLVEPINQVLKTHGQYLIAKKLNNDDCPEHEKKAFYQEIAIMNHLRNHHNIAKICGFTEKPYAILMKFYKLGSLTNWVKNTKTKKTKVILLGFMIDIAKGLQAIYDEGFVHCDLKPSNVLLDEEPETKKLFCVLTDFGLTQIVNNKSLLINQFTPMNVAGASIAYAPPEALSRLRGGMNIPTSQRHRMDVYSFGVVIIEVISRRRPW